MDGGAWRATVHGVTKSWIPLSTSTCSAETRQLLSSEPCVPAAFSVDEVRVGVGRWVDAIVNCAPSTPTPTLALTCAALLSGGAGSTAKRV